jgi:hypothetical protein
MNFDLWHKILAAAALAALVAAAFIARQWLGAHDAWIRAQATQKVQQQVIDQVKLQEAQIVADQKARDHAAQEQLAAMQAEVDKVQSAAQIARWLPAQIATAKPITIQVPQPTKENPHPAAQASIPREDLPQLRDYVESCKECSVKLHTAQQDLAAEDQRLELAGEKLSAVEKQRDAALKAARGGGFWHRLWTATKWFALGAAAGAVAAKAAH